MNYNSLMLEDGRNCKIYQSERAKCFLIQPIKTILEWNLANHFQHTDERIAKGFAWLINQTIMF